MANLQYIGARYVPIVYSNPDDGSSNWKSGVAYENLVIVTYQDNSYTSRKPVPSSVGNPPSNPAYWAKSGDFNAALTALQNQVDNIDNVQIPAINDKIDEINGRPRCILIGDSYSIGTNAGTQYGWLAQVKTILGLTEGVDVYSYGVGGYGFIGNVGTFISLLYQAISDISNKDSITNIFVAGGFNDIGDSGIENAIRTFCSVAKSNFPNAKIKIGFVGAFCNKKLSVPVNPQAFLTTKYQYLTAGGNYECDIDLYGCLLEKYDYMGFDGIHPTIDGYNYLAKFVARSILGMSRPSVTPIQTFTFTPIADLTEASGMQHYWRRNADSIIVWFNSLYLTGTITSTDNTNTTLKIGNISDISLEVVSNSDVISGVPISLRLRTTDNVHHNVNGVMNIQTNGDVTIRCPIFKSNGDRYLWSEVNLIENVDKWCTFPIDTICV